MSGKWYGCLPVVKSRTASKKGCDSKDGVVHSSDFEIETTKHAAANNNVIEANRIFSPTLVDAKLLRVLRTRKAVVTQDKILITVEAGTSPTSPVRRRMT